MKKLSLFLSIFVFLQVILFGYNNHPEFDRRCFVYPKNKVIYLYIHKTASSTVRKLFNESFVHKYFDDLSDSEKDSYIKLLIVRNPYSRAVSSYLEVMKCRGDGPERTSLEAFYNNKSNPKESFRQFLEAMEKEFYDLHAQQQYTFLESKNLSIENIDFIVDFDHLWEDLTVFSKRYNILLKKNIHENCGEQKIKRILKNYVQEDQEIREMIERVYQGDFVFYDACMQRREGLLEKGS